MEILEGQLPEKSREWLVLFARTPRAPLANTWDLAVLLAQAGEGGIILTNDDALEDLVWSMANVGRTREGLWYEYAREGWNSRLTEWQGAILLAQLERADELTRYFEERLLQMPREPAADRGVPFDEVRHNTAPTRKG